MEVNELNDLNKSFSNEETSTSPSSSISPLATLSSLKLNEKFSFGKCKICNDLATGLHYGLLTCEGCKVSNLILKTF